MKILLRHSSIRRCWHVKSQIRTVSAQRGRIVFTASKGLPGVGFSRAEWNAIKDKQSGTVTRTITDTTLPTGPVERVIEYQAPFTLSNREQDYQTVWTRLDVSSFLIQKSKIKNQNSKIKIHQSSIVNPPHSVRRD